MGQGQSAAEQEPRQVSSEQLSHELARRFATRCFTQLELYEFRDNFRTLADTEASIRYWKEETLTRFLRVPDILAVGSVLFQSATWLGAFPFPSMAPCILDFDALIKVVTLMTDRHSKVLKKGRSDKLKLLFQSFAVFDRRMLSTSLDGGTLATVNPINESSSTVISATSATGFAVDAAANDNEEIEDDDDLALAALESLDAIEVFRYGEKSNVLHSHIPADNFRRLIILLLFIAPLSPQDDLSSFVDRLSGSSLEDIRRTADNILWSFGIEKHPGILYRNFDSITRHSLPFLFEPLQNLFEKFLFSKSLDLSKAKNPAADADPVKGLPKVDEPLKEPLLPRIGEILDLNLLSQLSFFIPGSSLFRRLRPLYFGGESGFSLGSFETKVVNWRAPTILLVSGTRLSSNPSGASEKSFHNKLPPKRFADSVNGNSTSGRVVYGAYIPSPWKQTHKDCFGDQSTLLFQLEPIHEVFKASHIDRDYISFTKHSNNHSGIGIGAPIPKTKSSTGSPVHIPLGPVSLVLDDALEYAVFTHVASGGGSFLPSSSRRTNWQDRFEIESLEVWGCGGDEEAERQRAAWAFEEREALSRRQINLGKDPEADRQLLEMAGIIGQNRSGGSV